MLGAEDFEDISWIFDFDDESNSESYSIGVAKRSLAFYRSNFSFFTPYINRRDFFYDIISLVRHPLLFAMGAVVMAFNTLIAACYCVGSILLTLGAIICMSPSYRNSGLEGVSEALIQLGRGLMGTAAALLLTVLSVPHNLAALISHTYHTISSGSLIDCCSDGEEIILSPYLSPDGVSY